MLFTTLRACAALIPLCAATSPVPVQDDPNPASAMAEDVEVMRRLLVRGLESTRVATGVHTYELDYRSMFIGLNGNSPTAHSNVGTNRGYHVPGVGVFYSIDLSVPLDVVTAVQAPVNDPAADEEWSKAEREVRGQGMEGPAGTGLGEVLTGALAAQAVGFQLDQQAIDRAVDELLAVLQRHAARIDQLRAGERLVVALHITGASPQTPWLTTLDPQTGAVSGLSGIGGDGLTDLNWTGWWLNTAQADSRSTSVVLQLTRETIASFAERALSAAELRGVANVVQTDG